MDEIKYNGGDIIHSGHTNAMYMVLGTYNGLLSGSKYYKLLDLTHGGILHWGVRYANADLKLTVAA